MTSQKDRSSGLSKTQAREFLHLIDLTGSSLNGERTVGRLKLSAFVDKHGKDVCDKFYSDYKAALKKRQK